MFAAAPPLIGLLIRYYISTEAIKFATGTERKDWIKMSLDLSEQIGNVYQAQLREGTFVREPPGTQLDPVTALYGGLITAASASLGAPGTAAEAFGYTFPGAAAKQRQRLEAEVMRGFPTTQRRIKGAPKFAKRKLSNWNRQVKAGMKVAKENPKVWPPKLPGTKVMEMVTGDLSKLNKGKKAKTKKQKKLKAKLKTSIGKAFADWKKRKGLKR